MKRKFQDPDDPNLHKKIKTAQGPDIPSSNLIIDKNKKVAKIIHKLPPKMTSIPDLPLKMKHNPDQFLYKMAIPDKYKEVLGPDISDLKKYAKEKLKKEQYVKSLVKKGILPPQKAKPVEEEEKKPETIKNVFWDEAGRMKDEKGNAINLKPKAVSILKVNINRQKEERVKAMLRHQKGTSMSSVKERKFFDHNLLTISLQKREKKKNHAFHFIEKGSIVKKAESLRKRLSGIQEDGSTLKTDENQVENSLPMGLKRVSIKIKHHDPIPDLEWWDVPLIIAAKKTYLPNEADYVDSKSEAVANKLEYGSLETHEKNLEILKDYQFDEAAFRKDKITSMIEHPIPFKIGQTNQNVVIPMYLTKKERKKIKRRKRMEKEREKQDKVRLGLLKPPPPKIKLSNMMRILGNEAVSDPSKVEKEVKKSIAERLKGHLQRNAARKLTREMKAEKIMRRLKRDSAIECRVAVFRIEELHNRSQRFKVDKNAQQLALHGLCLISDKYSGLNLPTVVVVEGGPKAIKFYKKLLLKRIKWDKDDRHHHKNEGNMVEEHVKNRCDLVWEGVVKDHNFKKWSVIDIRSEVEGKRCLNERNVEYYWDMVMNYQPPN